jgi:tRNA(Ile)-lysidine synthase
LVAAVPLGARVVALHVHHGLSRFADDWLTHCERQCGSWAELGLPIAFDAARIVDKPGVGESVEAWARKARYGALRDLALRHGAGLVLLAQHRRDQAETFLLQALRGGGPAGLAGMPQVVQRGGVTWVRPWLRRSPDDIEAYVAHHRIEHVVDDTNSDRRFARNRVRLSVWPALIDAFPGAEAAMAASAVVADEARACLQEVAREDMRHLVTASGGLKLAPWFELSFVRRKNVLREWLLQYTRASASASLVSRLMTELRAVGAARWPQGGFEVRAYRGVLSCAAPRVPGGSQSDVEQTLSVLGPGDYPLPGWQGTLRVQPCDTDGVPLAWLARLELRPRGGAERFQFAVGRPPRSLKRQFQSVGLALWDRNGPLLFSGGQLVFVSGLGIDARALALAGQAQVGLSWVPDRPA